VRGGRPVRATNIVDIDIDTGDHADDGSYRSTSPADTDGRADPDQRTDSNPKAQ